MLKACSEAAVGRQKNAVRVSSKIIDQEYLNSRHTSYFRCFLLSHLFSRHASMLLFVISFLRMIRCFLYVMSLNACMCRIALSSQ